MFDILSMPMLVLLYAMLYGITIKIADLLDEHGLKLFKGASILFGVLWGLFAVLLILSNPIIANIILAMNIAFIIRRRIDYLNHAIAVSMIIIVFVLFGSVDVMLFSIFCIIFIIFGGLKDYVDDIKKIRKGLFFNLNEISLYYPVPTFIYCVLFGNWMVFYVFLVYNICYNLTKYYARHYGYK